MNEGLTPQAKRRKQEAKQYHESLIKKDPVESYYSIKNGKVTKKTVSQNGNVYSVFVGMEDQCKDYIVKLKKEGAVFK